MSLTATASRRRSGRLRAIVTLGLPVMLGIGFASSLLAQSSPGGYGPGSPGMRPGGGYGTRMGSPRGGGHRMLSPETIEGPASPDVMRDSMGLNGSQLQGYTRRYENHMANTKAARDSLRSEVQAMRAAFESGDRSAARDQRDRMDQQSKELSKQDEDFDKGLKDILTKDQQKRYQKWKDNREKADQEQWQQRRSSGSRAGWVSQVQVR